MNRINSSKKATNATLANGLARGHRSNPAACIRVLNLYGIPVLMSGLASQVLSTSEVTILHQHHKSWLQNLQKLHDGTPQAVTYFLAGSLPSTAILHIRQLCLLGMISRLPDDPLYHHACYILTTGRLNSNSWFSSVRTICLQYSLPHPLSILVDPPSKFQFKKLVKSKVIDYWEQRLRAESGLLPSLKFFHPQYMSLAKPHPIWWTAGENPYEVSKAVIQCRMLSGRYRTRQLTSKWSESQCSNCPAPQCGNVIESLEHLLLECPAYAKIRSTVIRKCRAIENPAIMQYINFIVAQPQSSIMQFLLDSSALPYTQKLISEYGCSILTIIFSLTRTWCYSVHRERLKLIKST